MSMAVRERFHHGDLRAELLKAALAAIEQCGLDRLSLSTLAEQAGVSRAAPYRHFGNKHALLAELAAIAHDDLLIKYREALSSQPPESRLRRAASAYLDLAANKPQLFQLLFADDAFWHREGGERPQFVISAFTLFETLVTERIGVNDPKDVRLKALTAWSTLHGFAMLRLTGRLAGFPFDGSLEDAILDLVGIAGE